jgi:benzoylformate decarboxylase
VAAVRVERPDQVADAVREALAHDGPFLVDLVIGRRVTSTRSIAGADRA